MSTYDPKKVKVIVGTSEVLGFASGTFVEVERQEDAVNLHVGTQGEYAWALNRNRSGTVTLTLLQTAQSNDVLQALATADEQSGTGARPFRLEDLNGRTLVSSKEVRVQRPATVGYGAEVGPREWVLLAGELEITVGGNLT